MSRVSVVYEVETTSFFESVVDRLLSGRIVLPIPPQYNSTSAAALLDNAQKYVDEDTPPGVIYVTSGTTGGSKLVLRSWESLSLEAMATRRAFDMGPDSNVCITSPLSHSFGFAMGLAAVSAHARYVCLRSTTNIFERMRDIRLFVEGRPGAIVTGVPFIYRALLRGDMKSFEQARCYAGGDFTHPDLIRHWYTATGRVLNREYGLSEAGIVSVSSEDDPFLSVGKLVEGVEVYTADDGELLISRDYLPWKYLAGESPETFGPGFIRTGDLGYEADGLLYIKGRKKNVIVVGGMKIVPEEVEQILCDMEEVAEAMVSARMHRTRGDEPVAHVVLEDGASLDSIDLERRLREILEPYKVPRQLYLVDELPRNIVGKVART